MPFAPAQTVLHYRIVDRLGEGGMGVVWRAVDTTLDREVAIKVLPDAFAARPERLLRFEREAKLLAGLSHPNIAALHSVHVADGTRFLVMELVPGEDLGRRIERGPLALDEALRVALQIAEGLEAAHEQGIAHRDLKPANVRVTPEGRVKILDFGLAKAFEPEAPSPAASPSLSPTITSAATMGGVLLGTASYMSPEQARGRPADRRADVWAFGCVLHEMLAGRRAFDGETASDALAAVLAREPDPATLPAGTPPRVRSLLDRCLRKNVRQRLQSIGDARVEIEEILGAPPERPVPADEPRGRPGARLPVLAAVGLCGLALGVAATWSWRPGVADAPVRKFEIHLDAPLADTYNTRSIAISPDGTMVAYTSDRRLWLREWSRLEPRALPVQEGAALPFWSPDSSQIAYAVGDKLWRIPAIGGPPAAICTLSGEFNGGAWGANGRIVFAMLRGPLMEVAAGGGDPRTLLDPDAATEIDFHQPSFLPDGRTIVCSLHRTEGVDTLIAVAGTTRREILRVEGQARAGPQVLNLPVYSPTGHLLYQRDQGTPGVWALPFSPERLEPTGAPFLLVQDARSPSVSNDGALVFLVAADLGPAQLVLVDPEDGSERTLGEPRTALRWPTFSPDGRRAVAAVDEDGNQDLWIYDLADGSSSRVTFSKEDETSPAWHPDGTRIAFSCSSERGAGVCVAPVDGSGETRRILEQASNPEFSPDGRYLIAEMSGRKRRGLLLLDLAAGGEPTSFLDATFDVIGPQISPDGRFVAYQSGEGGRLAIYVKPFPAGDAKWMILPDASFNPRWRSDGREMLYVDGASGALMAVPLRFDAGVSAGRPREVRGIDAARARALDGFDTGPGAKLLMVRSVDSRTRRNSFFMIQNWAAEFDGRE